MISKFRLSIYKSKEKSLIANFILVSRDLSLEGKSTLFNHDTPNCAKLLVLKNKNMMVVK